MIDWSEILGGIVQAFLLASVTALAPIFFAWIFAEAKLAWAKVKGENPELAAYLEVFARSAVKSAEQLGLSGQIEEKKEYAIDIVETWLEQTGLEVDVRLIEAAIEAAVIDEFNKAK